MGKSDFPKVRKTARISVRAESIPTFANLVRDGHPNYPLSKTVAHHATPELAQAMDQSHVAISTAARVPNDGASPPAVAVESTVTNTVIIFSWRSRIRRQAAVCRGSER